MKAELNIVWAERARLQAKACTIHVESDRLSAEAYKLSAEANKLYAEANKLWSDAVYRICGPNVSVEWLKSRGCIVAGVMEFLS